MCETILAAHYIKLALCMCNTRQFVGSRYIRAPHCLSAFICLCLYWGYYPLIDVLRVWREGSNLGCSGSRAFERWSV